MTTPTSSDPTTAPPGWPDAPVERWLGPIKQFLHIESASGIVLMACTALALALANSPLAGWYASIWKAKVELTLGPLRLAGDIGHLVINDGLMTIFFFLVGLEIKRELVVGELRDPRNARLPLFAAAGGMAAPALIYLVLQWGQPGQRGWAVPAATDIAFVVGLLALFGRRVPFSLKIFLLTLAIIDDLGAVLIIAFVFTESIAWGWLGAALAGFALAYLMNRAGVRKVAVYVLVGAGIWLAMLQSGAHPTVAGVLLGLLTPASAWIGDKALTTVLGDLWHKWPQRASDPERHHTELAQLEFSAREAVAPLHRLETALHPWVAFVIMPLFALANAGVPLQVSALSDPVALAVAAGLTLGKPLGIGLMAALAVWLGLARLPDGANWGMLVGAGCLAGIGFTMALFINGLAFGGAEPHSLEAAGKVGTFLGSLLSAILGAGALLLATRSPVEAGPDSQD